MSLNSKNLYDNDLTFTPFFRFIDDFNTYANQGSGENANANATFTPKFDIYEHKHSFTLHGELPGVEQKDIDIEFSDPETLKISGKSGRHYEHPKEEGEKTSAGKIWRSERNVGHFSRSFAFPQAVDQDEVKATLKNGILTLTVPKTRKEKTTKKIAIS